MNHEPVSCYWNRTGFHQIKMDRLQSILPSAGPVLPTRENPELELLRKAVNCYSDLYNSRLANRGQSFAAVFKFRSTDYLITRDPDREYSPNFYSLVEQSMDDFILTAWLEQKTRGNV